MWDDGDASMDDIAFAEKFLHGFGFFGGSGNDDGNDGERGSGERKQERKRMTVGRVCLRWF